MTRTDSTAADVRAARERLKETQAVFGARFGVDQSTVHLWETKGLPRRGTARTLFERLNADLEQRTAQ